VVIRRRRIGGIRSFDETGRERFELMFVRRETVEMYLFVCCFHWLDVVDVVVVVVVVVVFVVVR